MYSRYFLAKVKKEKAWFVSGCIRNFSHIVLERGFLPKEDIFEFFVSPDFVNEFVELMENLKLKNYIFWFKEEKNRFLP